MNPPNKRPLLYLITKGEVRRENFPEEKAELIETVRHATSAGVDLIQIREKHLEARVLFELVCDAVKALDQYDTRILVNERFDVALAAGAHGVHLPASALDAAYVRENVPSEFIIGVSAHNDQEITNAKNCGAEFATLGSVFESPGKAELLGLDRFRAICAAYSDFPILALGGVDETNVDSVLDAGAAGIAAIRALNDRKSLARITSRVARR